MARPRFDSGVALITDESVKRKKEKLLKKMQEMTTIRNQNKILVLNDQQIRNVIEMEPVLALMADLFQTIERTRELPKQELVLGGEGPPVGASAFLMAASTAASACVKILIDVQETLSEPGRPARQRSFISVIDTASAELIAVCEGRTITAYRTAAVSAVATKALARADAKVLGLIGAGNLARLHAIAIASLFDLDEIVVWSRSEATRDAFAREVEVQTPVRVVTTPAECVRASDIVCTLTPSREPQVSHEWIKDGTHINAVGSPPRPAYRELTSDAVARSRLVVDDRVTALAEAGDIVIPIREGRIAATHILGDLGEVVAGKVEGRRTATDVTLFKSVGLAIEDAVTARWVVERALAASSLPTGAG